MIIVRMRVQNDDFKVGELIDHATHVSDSEAGIEQERMVLARNKE